MRFAEIILWLVPEILEIQVIVWEDLRREQISEIVRQFDADVLDKDRRPSDKYTL